MAHAAARARARGPPRPIILCSRSNRCSHSRGDLRSFHIEESLAVTNVTLQELPFPDGAAVT